jgi:SAM-dependent methyltransferase
VKSIKNLNTYLVKYAIDKVKRNRFVQNLFESPFDLNKFPKMGQFHDSNSNSFELLHGLRSKIKPGWEGMLVSKKTEITQYYLKKKKRNGEIAVEKILPIINALGKSIKQSNILEIGCDSGGASYSLAEFGASRVVGTEFSGYKVKSVSSDKGNVDQQLNEVNEDLKKIRQSLASYFINSDKVDFVDDDICNSMLTRSSFDIVCSWEVLEHLHDTEKAFAAVYQLLKKDGISVHEYNPFFCLKRGHSLCTLDFLWGHTRLSEEDFSRYISEIRPDEKDRALSFYKRGLNRMTMSDLKDQIQKAGLKIISVIPFTKEQHLRMIDRDILIQTQSHYPKATILDLAAPRVYVVVQK